METRREGLVVNAQQPTLVTRVTLAEPLRDPHKGEKPNR